MSQLRLRVCARPLPALVVATLVGASGCGDGPPADRLEIAPTAVARQALQPVNDLPLSQTTNEDTRLTFSGDNALTVSDDNSQIQVQLTVTNGTFSTVVNKPEVTVTGSGTPDVIVTGPPAIVNEVLDRSYYQPAPNFNGAAQLQMNSQDTDGEVDIDVMPITVTAFNDPPTLAVPTATLSATEDMPYAVSVTVNDVDLGGGDIQVSLSSNNGTLMTLPVTQGLTFSVGTGADDASMTFRGDLTDVNSALNGLTITPDINYVGASTVTVTVDDLGQTGAGDPGVDNETLTLNWGAVNDPPVNSVPTTQSIDEDTSLTFSTADGTRLSVSDVDAPTTILQVTLSATGGTLTLGSTSGVSFVTGDGAADASVAFTGTLAQLNAALDGTVFAPNANFAGTAVVTMVSNDLGNSGAGGAKQDTDRVDVVVSGINDAPVNVVPGPQAASEDVTLTFANVNQVSVTDVDAATLQITLSAENGTLTLPRKNNLVFQQGDGTADATMRFTGAVASVNSALDGMQFLSTLDYSGSASVTIETSDLGATGAGGALTDSDTIDISVAPVNDPPSAANDTLVVVEDAAATTLLPLANDTFAPDVGEALSIVSASSPANGTVTSTATELHYTPAADFNGVDTFTYTLSDGVLTDTATVTVTVTAVNDPPTAVADSFTVSQGTATTLGVLSNDTDAPDTGETLTVTQVTQPQNGTVVINADNTLRLTPSPAFVGDDSFTYTISDGALTATATVSLTVTAVITQPVNTLPGPQTTSEDVPLLFSTGDGNPLRVADENNATLTVSVIVTNGTFKLGGTDGLTSHSGDGTASVTAQGPIAALNTALENARFTPAANFSGSAALTLTSSDSGGESDVDTLTLTVSAINDAPTNTAPTAVQAATEDTPKTFSNLSVGDIDVGQGEVRVALVADNGTVVTLATTAALTLESGDGVNDPTVTFTGPLANVNAALNGLTVTPLRNYIGTSTLVLTSNDLGNVGAGGAKEDVDTVTISWAAANDAPLNVVPAAQETNEDVPLAFTSAGLNPVRVSDDDAGGAPIQVRLSVTNGTLSLGDVTGIDFTVGDGVDDTTTTFTASLAQLNGTVDADGALEGMVFTPAPGFTGDATLTIVTDDLGNTGGAAKTDSDTVAITVVAVNDAPVNTLPPQQVAAEDGLLVLSTDTSNAISVADSDATSLQMSLSATNGALSLATTAGLVFQAGDGSSDESMVFRGTLAAINSALNGLRFVPAADFHGLATVTVRSDDLGGTGLGGPLVDEDTLEIVVSAVNDPPVLARDNFTVDEDAPPTIFDVLQNDSTEPDVGETLTITVLGTPDRGGTVTTDGQTVTYTPLADFNGTERFDYTVSDGATVATERVTVTVNSINDLPVALDDAPVVPRNVISRALGVLANDSDADLGTVLVITEVTTPAVGEIVIDNGGADILYTAPAGYSGPDTFEYTITDGSGAFDTATVNVTVDAGENASPLAVQDIVSVLEDSTGTSIDVLANDQGITDTPLVVALVGEPTYGTAALQADNTVLYTPPANFAGVDSFQYSVTDADGDTTTGDVAVTVTEVDDVPAASGDQATTEEDTSVNLQVLANDRGLGDGNIEVTITSEPTFGTATVESDNSITFTPEADFVGQAVFIYEVSDGEQASSGAVAVVVTPVADAPVAVADTAATRVGELVAIDVVANDIDVDGDTVTLTAVGEATNGTATLVDGTLHYLPNEGFVGSDEVTYTIDDGTGLTADGVVVVGVGLDTDEDGLIDLDELDLGTDPEDADTDADLIPDGVEVNVAGTDPLDDDSDDDGLLDGNEDVNRDGVVDDGETDPLDLDTDGDGISDGVESGLEAPQGDDTDEEVFEADADPSTTTDPTNADSDGDGIEDGDEDKNKNGRVDLLELDPTADDAPEEEPPPPEEEGGCSAVTADGTLASLALLALLGRVRRRRGTSAARTG